MLGSYYLNLATGEAFYVTRISDNDGQASTFHLRGSSGEVSTPAIFEPEGHFSMWYVPGYRKVDPSEIIEALRPIPQLIDQIIDQICVEQEYYQYALNVEKDGDGAQLLTPTQWRYINKIMSDEDRLGDDVLEGVKNQASSLGLT